MELNWLPVLLIPLGCKDGSKKEVKLVGVESVAVVWEVRESVYTSSSLLSSVRNLSGISLEEEVFFDISPEASCLEASLGSVGVAGRGEDPFPSLFLGCLWHTRQPTIFFLLFFRVWGIFPHLFLCLPESTLQGQ